MLTLPTPVAVLDVTADDGATFYVRRHGKPGATRILVSHGNGFAVDGYLPFWSPLLRDFDVVVFDMRNHGRNPPAAPPNHGYDQFARDFAVLRRAVGEAFGTRPTAGLFHSMTAQTAMKDALQGGLWDALVLFDPPNVPPPDRPVHKAMAAFEHRLAHWAQGRRRHFADPRELAADYAGTRAGGGWVAGAHELMASSVLRRRAADWTLCCPPELEAQIYLDGITLGLWPRRQDFAMPVKIVAADPDEPRPVPTALSNQALAREGSFDHVAIPNTGHLLQLQDPMACVEAAVDFLRGLGLAR